MTIRFVLQFSLLKIELYFGNENSNTQTIPMLKNFPSKNPNKKQIWLALPDSAYNQAKLID